MKKEKEILTAQEAAKLLRISMPTMYKIIKQGIIKAKLCGGQYRIERKNLVMEENGNDVAK